MKSFKKVLAVFLAFVLAMGAVSLVSYAKPEHGKKTASLPLATVSDIHFYPESLMGSRGEEWLEFCRLESKMYNESESILRTALETLGERAKETGVKYVLVPGDLTKDSEYEAHAQLAKILEEYEAKYGLQFLVINGNHDVNTTKAMTFENDKKESTRAITADEFRDVYKNLGYDLAVDTYAEKGEKVQGALSYVADLDENYRLIAVDSCLYSFDEPDKDKTSGMVTPELMQWIKKWTDDAKENGKTPLLMIHHNMAPHMECEPSIAFAFTLDNYLEVSEQLADWGIHYSFSGHLHTNDTAAVTNDNSETLYDIETNSLTGYPNMYREMTISTYEDGENEIEVESIDFDAVKKMSFDGVTYDNGEYRKKAFDICFGGGLSDDGKADVTSFAVGLVKNFAGGYIDKINEAGGILPFLKTMNIDLRQILSDFLSPYIKDGIKIGSYNVFTVDNLMWFIEDLCDQISEQYLENPQKLYDLLTTLIDRAVSVEVADVPCTKFIDTLGFGDKNKNGTLADAVLTAIAYWFDGNEDISDDEFMKAVIANFDHGTLFHDLFYKLVNLLLTDVVENGLLAKLEIRVDKLLADDFLQKKLGEGLNFLLGQVLRGDYTYLNLVKIVFGLGVLPYSSLYDVLDGLLMSKYLTESQLESIGIVIAWVLSDLSTDKNPMEKGDSGVSYFTTPVTPEATRENYRLPTMVSQVMGEDSQTESIISWYTKYTLESSDIEIYKADSEPQFTGKANSPEGFKVETKSETVERSFPGIDIGILGLFPYKFRMVRHTALLSGLEKGATYYYRVGNEKYGWWSETGKITTADGSKDVTFFHMTDPQSQNVRQYERAWVNVLKTAFEKYPSSAFIMNTGDLVDHGDNNHQWQYMFDTASEYLMNTYLMPATGNHEGKGTNATANYFTLPGLPEQDTTTGVYYSYTYNNVHFAVLNSNDLDEKTNGLSEKQLEWLKADMEASDAQWKFVALHKAPYSQGSHYKDDDVCAIRDQLSVLMPQLGIDMVFTGHDHVYLRTASLINNEKAATDITYLRKDGNVYKTQVTPDGTTYVITGCAGVKSYIQNDVTKTDKYFPRGEKVFSLDCPMFACVEIKDGVLYFNAYGVNEEGAQEVDRFAIQKDTTQGEVVSDYKEAEEEEKNDQLKNFFKTFFEYIVKIFKVILNIFKIYILRVEL